MHGLQALQSSLSQAPVPVRTKMLSAMLNTYHNLYFYLDTMRQIRDAIASFRLREYLLERVDREECRLTGRFPGKTCPAVPGRVAAFLKIAS